MQIKVTVHQRGIDVYHPGLNDLRCFQGRLLDDGGVTLDDEATEALQTTLAEWAIQPTIDEWLNDRPGPQK